jgi:hypothetical protein
MFLLVRRNKIEFASALLMGFLVISATRARAEDAKPTIHVDLAPSQLAVNTLATLTATVNCPVATQEQTLQIFAPPGFTVSPSSFQLGSGSGVKTRQFQIQTPHTYLPKANWEIVILLSDKNGDLASSSYPFDYGAGISVPMYFLIGVLGIAMGYIARLVVDSLNSLPKPVIVASAVAPSGGVVPDLGWFTDFIRHHYYLMDFFVTLLLGFLALVALVKDNHAPDSGLYWYSALGLGFGIGLLTNSDLITRLRTR